MANAMRLARRSIETRIVVLRGERVMLDADLASVYSVSTKQFNQAVKRNTKRFPRGFRFRLTARERDKVVTNCDHLSHLKFSPALPWAYTEHGAIMAATVLNSPRAVDMSVFVVRAFVRLRELTGTHAALAAKLAELERKVTAHDDDLKEVIDALRMLLVPPHRPRRTIGFSRA